MIRFLFCLLLSCVSFVSLQAQELVKAFRICHIEGSIFVSLEQELTFDFKVNNGMTISAVNLKPIVLSLNDMNGFVYTEIEKDKVTGILHLPTNNDVYIEGISDGYLLKGLASNEVIAVFNAEGRVVSTLKVGGNGSVSIITANLSTGAYIVKVGNRKTFKFLKP